MNEEASRFLPAELLIGVPQIDAQHAELFRRLVVLKENFLRDRVLLAADAESLACALREHYATEEQLAEQLGMDFSVHANDHQSMLKTVGKALNDVVEGRADMFGTLRYIEYWFERHILIDDMPLGEHALPADAQPGVEPAGH